MIRTASVGGRVDLRADSHCLTLHVGVDAGGREVVADPPPERVWNRLAGNRRGGLGPVWDRPVDDDVGACVKLDGEPVSATVVVDAGGRPFTAPAFLFHKSGDRIAHGSRPGGGHMSASAGGVDRRRRVAAGHTADHTQPARKG